MTHASLFSGIGGAEIAATWMGWTNLFHCEINPFGRKVLEYWYPNSESYEDITKTDFSEWRGRIDVLTAGFPCQPFSVAGQRKGADDDRYLWPQVVRAVREIRPAWVVGENVAGILTMVQPGEEVEVGSGSTLFDENHLYRTEQQYVLETVCQDLEREGYSVQPFVIPACAVGAPHRRDRVWIVAHADGTGLQEARSEQQAAGAAGGGQEVAAVSSSQRCDNRGDNRKMRQVCGNRERDIEKDKPEWDERKRRTCKNGTTIPDTQCFGSREIHEEIQPQQPDGKITYSDGNERISPHSDSDGFQRDCLHRKAKSERRENENGRFEEYSCSDWNALPAERWRDFPTQPPVCSRDDGISFGLDGIAFSKWRAESIKAYGNAIVPQVAYEIFRAIEETYNNREK